MYQPDAFKLTDLAAIHRVVQAHPLAQVITFDPAAMGHGLVDAGLVANLVPMQVHPEEGTCGVLRAHFARANPQWRLIAAGCPLLVSFTGVETYVTPAWYETKRQTGKVVPTWNYVTVQARGPARIIEDAGWMRAHLDHLTDAHEAARPEPWAVADAPAPYLEALMRGVVGFEMIVSGWQGVMKLSQNKTEADRRGVLTGLSALATPDALAMAEMLRSTSEAQAS